MVVLIISETWQVIDVKTCQVMAVLIILETWQVSDFYGCKNNYYRMDDTGYAYESLEAS